MGNSFPNVFQLPNNNTDRRYTFLRCVCCSLSRLINRVHFLVLWGEKWLLQNPLSGLAFISLYCAVFVVCFFSSQPRAMWLTLSRRQPRLIPPLGMPSRRPPALGSRRVATQASATTTSATAATAASAMAASLRDKVRVGQMEILMTNVFRPNTRSGSKQAEGQNAYPLFVTCPWACETLERVSNTVFIVSSHETSHDGHRFHLLRNDQRSLTPWWAETFPP